MISTDNLSAKSPELDDSRGSTPAGSGRPILSRYWRLIAVVLASLAGAAVVTAYLSQDGINFSHTSALFCRQKIVSKDRSALAASLNQYIGTQKGEFSVSLYELDSGASLEIGAERSFDAASTAKIPILLTLYREIEKGSIKKDELLTLTAADKTAGTGYFIGLPTGSRRTVAQTAEAMIKASDNTATNMILRRFRKDFGDSRSFVQSYMNSLGATGTDMTANDITTRDLALYLGKLHRHETGSAELAEEMLSLLTQDEKMDASFKSRIIAGVPEGIRVAHKIGSQTNSISDAAIVYLTGKHYVLAINVTKGGWVEADAKIAEISRIVFEYEQARPSAEEKECLEI